MKKIYSKIMFVLVLSFFCPISVFALKENEVNNVVKDTDDGIFSWVNREERINSDGSFTYSFYQGLSSDEFTITRSSTNIYCRSSYNGTTYIPAFTLTLFEKPHRAWFYKPVKTVDMSLNGGDNASFRNLHYLDGKYMFRMDSNLTRGVDSPISGYGEISNFGGRI